MTTITVRPETKERLADYKFGGLTYDELLNLLMDHVAIEDIHQEHLKEHYRRLETFKGVPAEEFKRRVEGTRESGS
jgi:hypothetical protein